jgi:hypothetical protein
MVRLLALLLFVAFPVAAANNDEDGFVWLDANTKIKLKPVGSAATGASAPEKTPEQDKKPSKKKKKAEK